MNSYYIKLNKMYLKNIYLSEEYVDNNFISHIEFTMNNEYCDTYNEENGKLLIGKLCEIGFPSDQLYLKVCD